MMKSKKHAKSAWIANSTCVAKPWGEEISWAALPSIHGKILYIEAGTRTSYKYHKSKNEVLFVLKGEANVQFGSEHTLEDPIGFPLKHALLEPGQCLNVQSGCPYRIEAITDCEIVEISDGRSGESDKVRIEDDYGRETTSPKRGKNK
tara:strand:+ start:515 stop:958 length:444 start_codon:yes stop_codon:yes gene_type:complete